MPTLDETIQMNDSSEGRGNPRLAPNTSEYVPRLNSAKLYDEMARCVKEEEQMDKLGGETWPVFDEWLTRMGPEEKCKWNGEREIMDECILAMGICSGQTFIETLKKIIEYSGNIRKRERERERGGN